MGYGKLEKWFIGKILFAKKFINDLGSLWLFGIMEWWNNGFWETGKVVYWQNPLYKEVHK